MILFEMFCMNFNSICLLTFFTKFHYPGPVTKSRNWCVYKNSYAPAMHHLSWTVEIFHSPRVLLILFKVFQMSFNTFCFLRIFTKFHDPGPVSKSRNWCLHNNSYAPGIRHLSWTVQMCHLQGCFWSYSKFSEGVSTLFVFWQFSPNFVTLDLSQNPEIGAYITTPTHLLSITYRGQLRCFTHQGCFRSYSKCSEWVSTLIVFCQFSPNFMIPDLSGNPEIGAYIYMLDDGTEESTGFIAPRKPIV